MSASARASLLVLGAAAFMVNADARVINPLLRIIATEFHTQVGTASIVISAYTLPYGLFQLFYGPLGDRIGKLRVKAGALALFALGTAACALVPNLLVFALLRFLTGVVAAAIIPLSLAYIGDKFPYETRQAALGRFMSAVMLGQIFSVTVGGVFGQYVGWRGIFILFGVISILVALALWREGVRFPDARKEAAGRKLINLVPHRMLLSRSAARLVIGAVWVEGFLFFGGFEYVGASLSDRFQLPPSQIGLMLAAFGCGGLVYSATVKALVRRLGELGILLLGALLLFAGFVMIAFASHWYLCIPSIALLGMGFFTMHSTLQTKATELSPEARGTAVSLFAFGLFLGQSTGVAFFGRVVESRGYPFAFALAGILLITLAIYLRIQFPRLPKAVPVPAKA